MAIAGTLSKDSHVVHEHGIDAVFSIVPGTVMLEDSYKYAREYIERTAANIAAVWKMK